MVSRVRVTSFCLLIGTVLAFAIPGVSLADGESVGMLGPVYHRPTTRTAASNTAVPGNLIYHGGRILPRSTTRAIYWEPPGFSFPANYENVIDQYFADIAADSGGNQNVYSVGTQYFDKRPNGTIRHHANYDVTDGGSLVVTDPFPSSGCGIATGYSVCLTDGQIRNKIDAVKTATGLNTTYFMLLPPAVDSCFGGNMCAHNVFCAYHSAFRSGGHWVLYANQPYATVPGCITGQRPNNNDADDTLNVVSHEHNEVITDPLGNAWFTRSGLENADKCSFRFGSLIGPNNNQVINGNPYYLQKEWSNRSRACLQRGH